MLTQHDLRLLTVSWAASLFIWWLVFRRYNHLRDKLLHDWVNDGNLAFGQLVLVLIASFAASPPISFAQTSVVWLLVWIGIALLLCRGVTHVYTLVGKNIPVFLASVLASTLLIGASTVGRLLWVWVLKG